MRIVYGGQAAFNALAFGSNPPEMRSFFEERLQSIGSGLSGYGEKFKTRATELFNRLHSDNAVQIAKAALNQVRGFFTPDTIVNLTTIEDLQIAQHQMRRMVMANPVVRSLYHRQRCDGYSDSYVDADPGKIGWDHYDYCRIMNGIVEVTDESWKFTSVAQDLRPGDHELDFHDQFSVVAHTWPALESIMAQAAKDPTSEWNNDL
jgi:uncharacterized cupin superfamily protein